MAEAERGQAAAAATVGGEAVSIISEDDKEAHERCINKFVDQNKPYDPNQAVR